MKEDTAQQVYHGVSMMWRLISFGLPEIIIEKDIAMKK